jgi:L-fuculose-phosphate aldolase
VEKLDVLKKQLCDTGFRLIDTGLTHGTCGNISCRVPAMDKIIITPSGVPYNQITPNNLSIVGFNGIAKGKKKPSLETPLHLSIYKKRDDVGAIIHTHSRYALAVSAVRTSVPVFLDEIFSHIGGDITVAPYALPGSNELVDNVIKKLEDKDAVLLRNHGAVCCGKNLQDAFNTAKIVETICHIYILSAILGDIKTLPDEGKEYQRAMFEMKKRVAK